MSEAHPAAARLQSSAMVVAALITTLGAITAACIQTGVANKDAGGECRRLFIARYVAQ